MKLLDKVVIVTGSGGGIGGAIAVASATEGANVVVIDINADTAREVANRIKAKGRLALAIHADVTKSQEVAQAVRATLKEFGHIDVLVNNVGGISLRGVHPFRESTEEDWDFVIELNLKSVLIFTRAVLEHMIERRSGRVISISSVAGVSGEVGMADYSAAKAGIIGFTRAVAKEVGRYNITVNCILPGPIDTPALLTSLPAERLEKVKKHTFLGRLGQPEDIAHMATFLASDDASFITGQSYAVSGAGNLA